MEEEQELMRKLSQFSCGGGRFYHGATISTPPAVASPMALSVMPLISSRKHCAASSPSDETPPLKKATEQPMQKADFPDLDLEFETEDMDESTKDKDSVNEYNFANTIIIDNDRTLVLDQHAVIALDEFVLFLNSNFVCRNCGKSKLLIQHQVVGIASSINWFCACR
jgi:hypothetical protein